MTNQKAKLMAPVRILDIRGKRVLLDRDLAELYGVPPIALRQQVKRNPGRFPADFHFRITLGEARILLSQSVIPERVARGVHRPIAFTQEGVAMLSSVLRSEQAVRVNVEIMRAFVRLQEEASRRRDLTRRLDELEARFEGRFRIVFRSLRSLIEPKPAARRSIGFVAPADAAIRGARRALCPSRGRTRKAK